MMYAVLIVAIVANAVMFCLLQRARRQPSQPTPDQQRAAQLDAHAQAVRRAAIRREWSARVARDSVLVASRIINS